MDRRQAWMPVAKDAVECPELCRAAAGLEISLGDTFLGWFRLWSWIDDHFPEGKMIGISFAALDRVSGIAGLAESLSEVGWIRPADDGLEVPEFSERWGHIAVRRYLARVKKREQRRSRAGSIDAAAVENLSIGESGEGQKRDRRGTETGQVSPKCPPKCPQNVPKTIAVRADLNSRSSPSSGSYSYSFESIESIRLEPIERKEFDWEKAIEDARKIARRVGLNKPVKDRALILRACVLAQTRLSEAWLWQALEAVEEHGPIKAAAYFRRCLSNGLMKIISPQAEFVGPDEANWLAALYRRLENLVPVSDEYIRRTFVDKPSQAQSEQQADDNRKQASAG